MKDIKEFQNAKENFEEKFGDTHLPEIIFRGFIKHEERWVYGDFQKYSRVAAYILGDIMEHECWEVDRESVGQYINRDDFQGTPIFTGDIVKLLKENRVGYVTYDKVSCCFHIVADEVIYNFGTNCINSADIKVIGNVFEDGHYLKPMYRIFIGGDDDIDGNGDIPCAKCEVYKNNPPKDATQGCCQGLCDVYEGTSDKYVKDDDWGYMCDNCPLVVITSEPFKIPKELIGKTYFYTKEEAEKMIKTNSSQVREWLK